MKAVTLLVSLWLLVPASPVRAQSSEAATDLPTRFMVDAGGFQMFVSTDVSLNSAALGGTTINLESLGLPDRAERAYIEGFWRLARRHQLSMNYTRLNRNGDGTTVTRDFTWGGAVYQAGVTAVAHMNTQAVTGVWRWAVYTNGRVELGPAFGAGYLWLRTGISATTTTSGPQGSTSTTISQGGNGDTVTGDIGGFFNWWAASRLYVRSDLRYILIKPNNEESSVTQGRASLTWYPWRHFGFGGQYTYDKFRHDRSVMSTKIGDQYRYQGFQILASVPF
jgi:hypothetical protein